MDCNRLFACLLVAHALAVEGEWQPKRAERGLLKLFELLLVVLLADAAAAFKRFQFKIGE